MSRYRNYNKKVTQHRSKEEFLASQNLRKNKGILIQKSDKGNSVVIVKKSDYLDKMEKFLNAVRKFEKVHLKNDSFPIFALNQQKRDMDNAYG